MGEYRLSWFGIFGVAVIATLGVNAGNLVWTKFVEPRISKK